jgi:hypothetical protein
MDLFRAHAVRLDSVSEGQLDLGTASGRMQLGVQGVIAQYQREQIIENVLMGMEQAVRQGRWINRAPTGYDMINGYLEPNSMAPIVHRVFELRAQGDGFASIARKTGVSFSTVRQIVGNRVYLGEVRLRDRWFPGIHRRLSMQSCLSGHNESILSAGDVAGICSPVECDAGCATSRSASSTTSVGPRSSAANTEAWDATNAEYFAREDTVLGARVAELRSAEAEDESVVQARGAMAQQFELLASRLAALDMDRLWDAATDAERRILVEDLIEAVVIYRDHLEVRVSGAPTLNVTLAEVGLREPGMRTSVSEGGLEP